MKIDININFSFFFSIDKIIRVMEGEAHEEQKIETEQTEQTETRKFFDKINY